MINSFLKFGQYEVIPLRDGFFEALTGVLTHARGGLHGGARSRRGLSRRFGWI